MARFEFNSDGLICIDDFVKGYLHMHAAQKAIVSNASAIVADLQPEMIEAQANLSKPKLIGAGRFIIHPLGLGSSVWDSAAPSPRARRGEGGRVLTKGESPRRTTPMRTGASPMLNPNQAAGGRARASPLNAHEMPAGNAHLLSNISFG